MRLLHPELALSLYASGWTFSLYVENCKDEDFTALAEDFDKNIRPVTCNIQLSRHKPEAGVLIEEAHDYERELWLHGEPLPTPDINRLLSLSESTLPDGWIDFDNGKDAWVFRSFTSLSEDQRACVRRAAKKIGITDSLNFVEVGAPVSPPTATTVAKRQGDLTLATSRQLRKVPGLLRDLVHQDEDEWRTFLARRAMQDSVALQLDTPSQFACLYDLEHCGDSRLSELLTLYDRVDIMPQTRSLDWSSKHQLSLADLQELVRLKRVRMILPYSVADYPGGLLEAVAEVDPSAIVFSRALASRTIIRGQQKEPLLYAPLTSAQRAAILSALSKVVAEEPYRALLDSYGRLFSVQHDMFMMRGALASLGFGVGAFLGDLFFKLRKADARFELMTCGAGIEWALGLGASYIPRDFGGYDETGNSQIIASYLGRTRQRRSDPVANRMHIITDGLLAVSGVPPLEVAKNFHSLPASRFRNVARRLLQATPSASELQEAVDQINADVKVFERRADRLAAWRIGVPVIEAFWAAVEHEKGLFVSAGAAWLYELLKDSEGLKRMIPETIRNELSDAKAILTGLATASSLDAVIVSRSRRKLENARI